MATYGGPFDAIPDGADMRTGKVHASRGKRKRLTSLTDEMRELRAADPLIQEAPRDREALTDGEKRASYDMLDSYIGDLSQHVAAKMNAAGLVRLEDWNDPEAIGGTQGLTASEQSRLRADGEKVIDGLSAREFKLTQREQEKRQAVAAEQHAQAQQQGNVLDALGQAFNAIAPDLAALPPELLQDAARRHAKELSYRQADFLTDTGEIDGDAARGFAEGVAEDLRARGWGQGAVRQVGQPAGSSTADLIRERNRTEGF